MLPLTTNKTLKDSDEVAETLGPALACFNNLFFCISPRARAYGMCSTYSILNLLRDSGILSMLPCLETLNLKYDIIQHQEKPSTSKYLICRASKLGLTK
ncbi:hypothetical protein L873DRAFT_858424 [Choiromyces venosus 120613-1]|uniref:Uncharacterized protein n=1 Tax=Choiromyces venosus 120613-1 TaxID=1336337 RepID=A0A3N4IS46_9PEZI|nr:hypothetical protein L873DRAFT_858424 [Choiromyces venosus 120613-1]